MNEARPVDEVRAVAGEQRAMEAGDGEKLFAVVFILLLLSSPLLLDLGAWLSHLLNGF